MLLLSGFFVFTLFTFDTYLRSTCLSWSNKDMPTPHNNHSHHNPPKNLDLQKALRQEQIDMEKVDVPIVTVSGTFKK